MTEACSRLDLENEINGLERDLASLAALTNAMAPVVGITGTKNGGKTSTVKNHVLEIFETLRVETRTAACLAAVEVLAKG